ncbi:MAG TPA: glycoside hydrolase family 2 TIM barrel-domain containing protein, partial [Tepidisphaeraceae bacterium]|nr:glycoside hydrolase family 2 TIM barrel-domain containing protein [Tepidisphaeraceae bacterium]
MGLFLAMAFSASVTRADIPRPEHPRPDFQRDAWLNLNGEWQFEIDAKDDGEARGLISGKDLASKIVVPFCPESKLSGVANTSYMKHVWYRRFIELPESMKGKRILLHFGAVDYQAWVYVNGQLAGTHVGENAAFSFDITRFLKDGRNELVVRVFDDLRSGMQPGGKQAFDKSEGCVYTRTTGIWQTVWLEAVNCSYVENISVVPDPDRSRVLIEAAVNGLDANLKLVAEAFADGQLVGSESITGSWRNQRMVVSLSQKKLWDTGSPFLYDLKFTLYRGDEKIDEVKSYFGLRKVTIDGRRILINDKPIFQRLILDQGFYPDGIWTAPSDSELKKDIERSMAAGFNGARLHQKVFEPRFLYWADKLGYLVWGEFPNWGYSYDPRGYAPYITEWTELLKRDRNHPAIVGWCAFNESGSSAPEIQQVVWTLTKAVDLTRPVLETSGWVHSLPNPEVLDAHDYDQNPVTFRKRWMDYFSGTSLRAPLPRRYGPDSTAVRDRGVPFMVSEFGG